MEASGESMNVTSIEYGTSTGSATPSSGTMSYVGSLPVGQHVGEGSHQECDSSSENASDRDSYDDNDSENGGDGKRKTPVSTREHSKKQRDKRKASINSMVKQATFYSEGYQEYLLKVRRYPVFSALSTCLTSTIFSLSPTVH